MYCGVEVYFAESIEKMSDNFDKIWSRFKADLIAQRGGVTRPIKRITNSDPGDEQPLRPRAAHGYRVIVCRRVRYSHDRRDAIQSAVGVYGSTTTLVPTHAQFHIHWASLVAWRTQPADNG